MDTFQHWEYIRGMGCTALWIGFSHEFQNLDRVQRAYFLEFGLTLANFFGMPSCDLSVVPVNNSIAVIPSINKSLAEIAGCPFNTSGAVYAIEFPG